MNNLIGGTKHRLAKMRRYAEQWNAKHDNPITWLQARSHGIGKIRIDAHGPKYWDNGRAANLPASVLDGLRDVGHADDIVSIRHKGWFRDIDQSETYRGHVWQIPARNGEPVFLAGFIDEMGGYATLDASNDAIETFSDKEDAARAADSLAERCAETEREYNERWNEARTLQDENDEDRKALRKHRARVVDTYRAIRALRMAQTDQTANIDALAEIASEAREAFSECLGRIIERNGRITELDVDV